MRRISISLILVLTFSVFVKSQTILNINSTSASNAAAILTQAQNLANSGQNVIVNIKAGGLISLQSFFMNLTNGSVIIQRDITALGTEGFGDANLSNFLYVQCIEVQMNNSASVTFKDLEFNGYLSPLTIRGGNNVTIDNVYFKRFQTAIDFLENTTVTTNRSAVNTLIKNCVFDKFPLPACPNIFCNYWAIHRENNTSDNNTKSITIQNNDFMNNNGVNISTSANIDNLKIEIKNNFSSNRDGMVAVIGDCWANYFLPAAPTITNNHMYNDYKFDLDLENNDLWGLTLINPLNYWRIENNTFKYDQLSSVPMVPYDFGEGGIRVVSYLNNSFNIAAQNPITQTRDYKLGFNQSAFNECTNQTFLNGNNVHVINPPGGRFTGINATIEGNNAPGCAVTEINGQDFKGSIEIRNNVSLRKCKILTGSGASFMPIHSILPISINISNSNVSGGNLVVNYSYSGITNADGNDIYVDFYKSNANNDLLDYIGEQFFANGSLTGFGTANIPVPSSVVLNPGDQIGMTITGLHPVGSTSVVAMGTSKAFFFNLPPACCFPDASSPIKTACLNNNFTFNIPSCTASGLTYSWDFGDGNPIATGNPITHQFTTLGNYLTTATVSGSGCFPLIQTYTVNVANCSCSGATINVPSAGGCVNTPVSMNVGGCPDPSAVYNWNFGDGNNATGLTQNHSYSSAGTYNISVTITHPPFAPSTFNSVVTIGLCNNITSCSDCIGSFSPEPGDYIISLWVKEKNPSSPTVFTNYANSGVKIGFIPTTLPTPGTFFPDVSRNKIIDGWQRIEEKFTVPVGAQKISMELVNLSSGNDSYFDDIRIHPVNSNMKSFVYDPVTLRLAAELDENNYATFYEYDEEGKLIRIKKETERGIMTIKEARNITVKK